MALITDSGKQLLKEALFKLKLTDENYALPEIVGILIGSRISLLGCTNNPESLNAVRVIIQRMVSDVNELRTFRFENAIHVAETIVRARYNGFFNGFLVAEDQIQASLPTLEWPLNSLTKQNTRETIDHVIEVMKKVFEGSGITTMIHNQKQSEPTSQPEQPANQE